MKSQWESVLQNLGEWQGSFTHLSPAGEVTETIPSLISLVGENENQSIHLVLTRFYPGAPDAPDLQPRELVQDFSAPGAGSRFFETGAFSEGPVHFSGQSKFGAELCLVAPGVADVPGDRRLRLVQLFSAASQLSQLTLIREQRVGSSAPERPPLALDALIGRWQGTATTLFPQGAAFSAQTTLFQLDRASETQLRQQFSAADTDTLHRTTATLSETKFLFEHLGQRYQTLLLPDGASATCPLQIRAGQPFFLELGWLLQPNLRQRLQRQYDRTGNWITATLMIEKRSH